MAPNKKTLYDHPKLRPKDNTVLSSALPPKSIKTSSDASNSWNGKKAPGRATKRSPSTAFHPFLSLPPEIRTRILRFAVQSPGKIEIERRPDKGLIHRGATKYALRRLHTTDYATLNRSSLAAALTSRLVHLEAIRFYYSLNTFQHYIGQPYGRMKPGNPQSDHHWRLQQFFNSIGPINTASIAHLSIIHGHCKARLDLSLLPFQLKSLEVDILEHEHSIPLGLENFMKGREDLILTVKSRVQCCSHWNDMLNNFAERANMIRREEDGRPVLTNAGQGGKQGDDYNKVH